LSASPPTTAPGIGALLSERVRERRLELGKKLAEVAAAADVSTGYLSAIENGGSLPSLPVLARLSHALELSLAEMLRTSASARLARGRVNDALGSKRLAAEGSDLQIVRLAGKPDSSGLAPIELGETDVFLFVYSGCLTVAVDGVEFELAPGDALQCDRPRTVEWRVTGSERAVTLWAAASNERTRGRASR
jgi:transcriptional regulator with XRE-family HTH domain